MEEVKTKIEILSKENCVVMFGASWCSQCKNLKKVFESKGIDYVYFDVETDVEWTSEELGIKSLPTTITFEYGEVIDKKIGLFNPKK